MAKPTILTVDDDFMVSEAITRDLLARYGADYSVVADDVRRRGRRGPHRAGAAGPAGRAGRRRPADARHDRDRAARAGPATLAPGAKLLLLTAYADTDVAIRAINEIGLDYYLLKPWDPPEERLYPVVDDLLGDWQRGQPRPHQRRPRRRPPLVGAQPRGQDVPGPQPRALPVVRRRAGRRGRSGCSDLADAGARRPAAGARARRADRCGRRRRYDLAERARAAHDGRAAALRRLHRRRRSGRPGRRGVRRVGGPAHRRRRAGGPGGQAGQSAAIENYLGFPKGLSRRRPHPSRGRPGRRASAPRWCWPATSSASRRAARCTPCSSRTRARSRPAR